MTESPKVGIRFVLLAGLLVTAGCGAPQPDRFEDGKVTKKLHPQAARIVRNELTDLFGTPEALVAAMRFSHEKDPAIEFGRITGVVVQAPEGRKLDKHQFVVKLTGEESIRAEDLLDLGLLWKTGAYRSAYYEAQKNDAKRGIQKEQHVPASFHVTGFEPASDGRGILSVNYLLESPPEPGDTFVLVGHRLRRGRGLYMQHCMHCHGYSGGGDGPTAKYLNPLPRDYRLGKFKFTSTTTQSKASRDDLKRTIEKGIPGTYMPAFVPMLKETEIDDIIEYVRWLALRGEIEQRMAILLAGEGYTREAWKNAEAQVSKKYDEALKQWKKDGANPKTEPSRESFLPETKLENYKNGYMREDFEQRIDTLAQDWVRADSEAVVVRPKVPRTPSTPESIARGRALFLSKKTLCWSCHGQTGRGNGYQTTSFQKSTDPLAKGAENPEPGLYDDWGNKIRPRNLTSGIYRGGRRPIDLFRRIASGIKGTPMSGFRTALKDEDIWDLVNYVMSIPYKENGTLTVSSK